jgi:hypothetical protein
VPDRIAGKAVDQQQRRPAAPLDQVDPLAVDLDEAAEGAGHGCRYSQPRLRK